MASVDLEDVPESTWTERFFYLVAVVAAGLSIGSMIQSKAEKIVIIAGVIGGFVVSAYMVYQARSLTEIVAMKKTYEATKEQVEIFQKENSRLADNVVELDNSVERLEDMQTTLDVITQTQGQNVEEFEKQIEVNKEILFGMKKSLYANVRQILLQVIYSSDVDGDVSIGIDEIDDLIERINLCNGVKLKEEKFRDAITKADGHLKSILNLVKRMVDNEEEENDIFVLG